MNLLLGRLLTIGTSRCKLFGRSRDKRAGYQWSFTAVHVAYLDLSSQVSWDLAKVVDNDVEEYPNSIIKGLRKIHLHNNNLLTPAAT